MIRDFRFEQGSYDAAISYERTAIKRFEDECRRTPDNGDYRPQFVFDLASKHLHLLLRRYCRGDSVNELKQHLLLHIAWWEESERLGLSVWSSKIQVTRHAWSLNLDFYTRCFWLVGLALTLEIDESDWQRLIVLLGNEGEDELLDRVIATRQPERKIGVSLCHPKQYRDLLATVQSPRDQQSALLAEYVGSWYAKFEKPPKKGLSRVTNLHERPYWYDFDQYDGAYFGFWCIEAVAVVRAFDIDDSLCLGLLNYPGDFLRPNGPSTHLERSPQSSQDDVSNNSAAQKQSSLASKIRGVLFAQK